MNENEKYLLGYKEYVENHVPFPWTVAREHDNKDFIGNNALVLAYQRFKLIMRAVKTHFRAGDKILDVGVYPGVLPQLFREFYPRNDNYEYVGCGLGFSEEFTAAMKKIGVVLYETDLDPRLNLAGGRGTTLPIKDESIDLAFCTDVIEHFYDPNHMLREINRALKPGGVIILTTDNVSRMGAILSLIKGESNYPPIMESSLYYDGDWRPHFREYSRDELIALLKYAGFETLEHQYYDAEFSSYKVIDNKLIKIKKPWRPLLMLKTAAKLILTGQWIAFFEKSVPHFRDNHLLVARKSVQYQEMLKSGPKITHDQREWMAQRSKYGAT
jgi:SAM-dependent methyltransferase